MQKQLGSADGNPNECSQILMGVNASDVVGIGTLGTIDLKKEELRTRNRAYQRQYRERKRTQAAGDNIVTREQNVDHKRDGTLAKKFERQTQVRQQPEPLASMQNNGDKEYLLNTNNKIRQGFKHNIHGLFHTIAAFVIMIFVYNYIPFQLFSIVNILCRYWCSKKEKG